MILVVASSIDRDKTGRFIILDDRNRRIDGSCKISNLYLFKYLIAETCLRFALNDGNEKDVIVKILTDLKVAPLIEGRLQSWEEENLPQKEWLSDIRRINCLVSPIWRYVPVYSTNKLYMVARKALLSARRENGAKSGE